MQDRSQRLADKQPSEKGPKSEDAGLGNQRVQRANILVNRQKMEWNHLGVRGEQIQIIWGSKSNYGVVQAQKSCIYLALDNSVAFGENQTGGHLRASRLNPSTQLICILTSNK